MDPYDITFKTWNKIAGLYEEYFMDLDLYDDTYNYFVDNLEGGSNLLELGCGPGNICRYLINKNPDLEILATDIAPNMLERAQKNVPSAKVRLLDVRNLNQLQQTFDGIIAGFCIPYLSQNDCRKLMKDAFELLNSKGLFYFSFLEGDYSQSAYESGSSGDKTFVYYHSILFFEEELDKNNFKLLKHFKKDYKKRDGSSQLHHIFVARKQV
jgi:cyclopropane fatty-acyl-phospholipid synthase-like methyltransferase